MLEYYRLINDKLFFESDPYSRLDGLYGAFQAHPKLSLGVAREIEGRPFSCDGEEPKNPTIREAMFEGKHDLLQVCFYLEHRARLAVLQAAVDLALNPPAPDGFGHVFSQIASLPSSFTQGLDEIRNDRSFRQYPLFWQTLLWAGGGFLLRDREDQEFSWLAHLARMPVEDVPRALTVFDRLFRGMTWFRDLGNWSQCRIVIMVPKAMQGVGAFHRRRRYGAQTYDDLGYRDYTLNDLVAWNDLAVDWLARRTHLVATQE